MEQLPALPYGIQDTIEVSIWPLALGWWIVLASVLLAAGLVFALNAYRKRRRKPRWLKTAGLEWQALQTAELSAHARLKGLAVLLRRIAIQQYGRATCASLSGEEWLQWLTEHDPVGFNWTDSGELLVRVPYMPTNVQLDEQQVIQLADAVRVWIRG